MKLMKIQNILKEKVFLGVKEHQKMFNEKKFSRKGIEIINKFNIKKIDLLKIDMRVMSIMIKDLVKIG